MVEEYKAREERKQAKEKGKGDEAKEKDKDVRSIKDGDKGKASPTVDPKQLDSPSTSAKAGHRRYELHRALFTMRQRELRMREQAVHAKERSKGVCLTTMQYWISLMSDSILRITPSPKRDYLETLVYTSIKTSSCNQLLRFSSLEPKATVVRNLSRPQPRWSSGEISLCAPRGPNSEDVPGLDLECCLHIDGKNPCTNRLYWLSPGQRGGL